jgi:hypothetical protein
MFLILFLFTACHFSLELVGVECSTTSMCSDAFVGSLSVDGPACPWVGMDVVCCERGIGADS